MAKTYQYKYYSIDGQPQGIIQNVTSEFEIAQEINKAGSEVRLTVESLIDDTNPAAEYDTLVDENGDYIVDDSNNNIVTGVEYTLTGVPTLGQRVEVWEFSQYNISGVRKFNGLVSKWAYSDSSRKFDITCLSYGVRLDNKIVEVLPNTIVTSNQTSDSTVTMQSFDYDPSTTTNYFAQTFQVAADVDLKTIKIKLNAPTASLSASNPLFLLQTFPPLVTIKLYSGVPTGVNSYIAGGSTYANITQLDTETEISFTFSSGVPLIASTNYYFYVYTSVYGGSPTYLNLYKDSTASYGSGTRYSYTGGTWVDQSDDMWFSITSSTGAVGNTFNSYDPSEIVQSALDLFISSGGEVSYSSNTIDTTNSVVSYTFRFNTYLELIQKCVELAPANYYWFVDPAYNLLYFKQRGTSADHILIKGTHVITYSLERSLENVKNLVYFSGGDIGSGTNLMDSTSNASSIELYGPWLESITDNRVTDQDSADILMDSVISEKSYPEFTVEVFVSGEAYDDSSFIIGQIVQLKNTNDIVNDLLLQIQAIRQNKDGTVLTLGQLTPTQSKRIEDVKRRLRLLETADNPDSLT